MHPKDTKKDDKKKEVPSPDEIDLETSDEYKKKILMDLDEEFEDINLDQDLRFDLDEFEEGYEEEDYEED